MACRYQLRLVVKTRHVNIPSNKNAVGQPMATFCRVRALQKMLSTFHTKNPRANNPSPVMNREPIEDLTSFDIRVDASDQRRRYWIRAAVLRTNMPKTTW